MKITQPECLIVLTPGFADSIADTTCIPHLQLFARALQNIHPQLQVKVIAFQYPFEAKSYHWHQLQVFALAGKNRGKHQRLRTWFKAWQCLRKLYATNKVIGVLSCWHGECALIGRYFARLHGLKHYNWLLGQDVRPGNAYVRLIKAKAEELIAISDFTARQFYINHKTKPAHIITNAVDTRMFSPNKTTRDIDVLGVGSLIPLKQYDLFVNMIKLLSFFFPNIKAVICGKGPEKTNLHKLIADLNLEGNITLMDEVSHQTIINLMQRSRVFLHPSAFEGFATVVAEALYAGTPVVSFINPMDLPISQLYVARDKDDMLTQLLSLLRNREYVHQSVKVNTAEDAARQMLRLYGLW